MCFMFNLTKSVFHFILHGNGHKPCLFVLGSRKIQINIKFIPIARTVLS